MPVCFCAPAYAKGESCGNPIELGPDYSEQILSAGTVWYIANTFDLPMSINFYPTNPNSDAPKLELDFSCTPGEYSDPILCSLFCKSNSAYVSLPHTEIPPKLFDGDGKAYYKVEFGEFYRNMLLKQGIDYNVPVYIKVTYYGGGSLQMKPDAFNSCMDGPKFMHLGDTVHVQAQDKNRHVIVPYVQWQYDSIRYVWTGTTPCTLAIGHKCDFDPTDAEDGVIMDGGVIQPGGQFKVSSKLLMQYVSDQINFPNEAGMYFAKFYSEEPGVMKIEKIPAPAPQAEAILMQYGEEAEIAANDTAALFAIPDSWIKAMQFSTPTDHIFKMYVGTTPNFYIKDAFATYQFDRTDDGHVLNLMASDMESLWSHKVSGTHYLYLRFECTQKTVVLPTLWTPSDCMAKAVRIEPGVQFEVATKSNTNYSLYYADWKDGDMTIAWTNTQTACPFYIADTCNVPNADVSPVFFANKAPKGGKVTLSMDTVNSWANKVDPDGFLYIRFYAQNKGKVTVTTSAPAEEDPQCNTYDSTLTVSAWDSCTWRGTTYYTGGTFQKLGNIDPETNCADTMYILRLTIHITGHGTYEETGCDSIIYNGKTYTESGAYTDTVYKSDGNRMAMKLHLTINHSSESEETQSACGSYEWHETTYTESGDYKTVLTNAAGCDSTVTLHLTIFEPQADTDTTATVWDSIVWYGNTYKTSGDYPLERSNEGGCEWTHTLHLTVHTTSHDEYTETNCDSIIYRGQRYTESGEYQDTVFTDDGNRTITTIRLTIGKTNSAEQTVGVYAPYTSPSGKIYSESGDYTDTITNISGCDSIITTHLTMYETSYDTIEPMEACDKIIYDGKTYTQSGEYRDTTIAGDGNRTIRILTLTIGHTSYSEEYIYKSGLYTSPRGNKYTESGDYEEKIPNAEGCDSIITLHITIGEATFDTIYFCRGYNREHEEQVNEILIRQYLPYTYEAPSSFNYREGMIVETADNQVRVDFRRAESNLHEHYVGGLTPIESIAWSVRAQGANVYVPVTVEEEPQWVSIGTIGVQILFRCGETYNDAMPMGLEETDATKRPIKRIENGQVVIIRGGAAYTLTGQRIGD